MSSLPADQADGRGGIEASPGAKPAPSIDVGPTRRPSVFVADESVRADLFDLWLADACPVRTASAASEVEAAFDESVAVALVRNELDDDVKSTIERLIKTTAPFCRVVVTTTEHVEIMFPGIEYDVCLSEPTTKDAVRETVSRLMRRAEYQRTLDRYYEQSVRATNMEVRHSAAELVSNGEYDAVTDRSATLKRRLRRIRETFDADDLAAVQQSIRPERGFGPESSERNKRRGEKHRPDTCVGCGLEWGVSYGGDIGVGYERLGAFAWKCTDCGTVQNVPDPSHRHLAHR